MGWNWRCRFCFHSPTAHPLWCQCPTCKWSVRLKLVQVTVKGRQRGEGVRRWEGGGGVFPINKIIFVRWNMQGGLPLALFYSLLGEARKNLQTFQKHSTNFPQTFQEQFIYCYHTCSKLEVDDQVLGWCRGRSPVDDKDDDNGGNDDDNRGCRRDTRWGLVQVQGPP